MNPLIDRQKLATDDAYRAAMRLRCQTDLLFLAHVLGYNKIIERVHRPAIDLCVKKDPSVSIEEMYQFERKKEFLHLDPRGCYKSTLSIVDTVQWVICYPEIRVCKLTATKPLATAIVGEITDHFVKAKDADPTDFQALFPEFCITKKLTGEYTAPCRKRLWREATVMAFSIETSISGWHFDVMDPDDVVDTKNSQGGEIATVKRNWRTNKKCLMPGGFIHFKGTRYNPFDLWGDIIEKAKPNSTKVLIRPAITLKNGQRLEPGDFPAENEIEILFPELFGGGDVEQAYEFLKKEFEDDYESFMCQYMNDAQGGNDVTFTKEAMLQATIPHSAVPVSGDISIAWRLACKSNDWKHAAAAVGLMDGGRLYVIDVLRGTYKPSTLAHRVAQLAKKHGVRTVAIEETPGARALESAIQNYALTLGWPLNINWLEYQDDDGARDVRIKVAEPLITSTRLLFDDSIVCFKEIYKQMTNYGMMEETEIPDVVARLAELLPKSIAVQDLDREQDLAWELAKQRAMYDRTHGLGQFAAPEPMELETPTEPESNGYGFAADIMPGLNG